jgi:hypothetical protein
MSTLYRGPPLDASYQVSVHLARWFQRRRILKIRQSETSRLWRPCLLTDPDEMSNLYRGPSIDASYQVSVYLAKRFQRWRFLKICIEITAFWIQISIFKQELSFFNREDILEINQSETRDCLWWPCLLTNRDKMSNLYRGPSIDASYQVSVHLDKRFQRRRF